MALLASFHGEQVRPGRIVRRVARDAAEFGPGPRVLGAARGVVGDGMVRGFLPVAGEAELLRFGLRESFFGPAVGGVAGVAMALAGMPNACDGGHMGPALAGCWPGMGILFVGFLSLWARVTCA